MRGKKHIVIDCVSKSYIIQSMLAGNGILLLFMVLALLCVIIGIGAFAVNGGFNKRNSNSLMRLRVLFQAIALAVVVIMVLAFGV